MLTREMMQEEIEQLLVDLRASTLFRNTLIQSKSQPKILSLQRLLGLERELLALKADLVFSKDVYALPAQINEFNRRINTIKENLKILNMPNAADDAQTREAIIDSHVTVSDLIETEAMLNIDTPFNLADGEWGIGESSLKGLIRFPKSSTVEIFSAFDEKHSDQISSEKALLALEKKIKACSEKLFLEINTLSIENTLLSYRIQNEQEKAENYLVFKPFNDPLYVDMAVLERDRGRLGVLEGYFKKCSQILRLLDAQCDAVLEWDNSRRLDDNSVVMDLLSEIEDWVEEFEEERKPEKIERILVLVEEVAEIISTTMGKEKKTAPVPAVKPKKEVKVTEVSFLSQIWQDINVVWEEFGEIIPSLKK